MSRLPCHCTVVVVLAVLFSRSPAFACANPNPCPNNCFDGNACTEDYCFAGSPICGCLHPAITCPDDNNPCTADYCNSLTGCVHDAAAAQGQSCSTPCVLNATCDAGVCSGPPRDCTDAEPCTDDGCNPISGCTHTWMGPGEALAVRFGDEEQFSWDAPLDAGMGTSSYDVARGVVDQLPVGNGAATDETCVAIAIGETHTADPEAPLDGMAFWYVVRARDECGPGTYGFEGRRGQPGPERESTLCP